MADQPSKAVLEQAADRLQTVLAVAGEGLSVQRLLILLTVAACEPEGIDQAVIAEKLSMDKTALSRSIKALASGNGDGAPLVKSAVDSVNRTRRIIRLTPKGRRIINKVYGDRSEQGNGE